MTDRRGLIFVAGLLVALLMLGPVGLPDKTLDWSAYSQPYQPAGTPTGTSVPTALFTQPRTATATATVTLTPPATPTGTVTTTPVPEFAPQYLPLILRNPAFRPVTGSVMIEGGACCVGGTAGDTINIHAAFQASSPFGDVTQMRTWGAYGGGCRTERELAGVAWEPLAEEKSFPVTLAINWIGFYVTVQYRDVAGYLSPAYCDDISVEGMPPRPTDTP